MAYIIKLKQKNIKNQIQANKYSNIIINKSKKLNINKQLKKLYIYLILQV